MSLEEYSKEIAFIRKVLLEGDFKTVVKCLQPFENRLDPKEFSAIMFCIHRQRLFELVEEPDEIELRELLEQDIVGLCTPEQYQQLFDFLTLEHVSEHPDFAEWTKLRVLTVLYAGQKRLLLVSQAIHRTHLIAYRS